MYLLVIARRIGHVGSNGFVLRSGHRNVERRFVRRFVVTWKYSSGTSRIEKRH